jgi:SAM-dependent methyltransferase
MPGGFVTYHAYDPDRKRLKNGKRLDPLARSFFRHAHDGIGVRSRAYAMAWRVTGKYRDATEVHWMSIACGVGQATFDAARLLPGDVKFSLLDMDADALAAARKLSVEYAIDSENLQTTHLNVIEQNKYLVAHIKEFQPIVVDAMGLFEYLSPDDAILLLKSIYTHLRPGASLFFTNMLPSHPHLHVHQRGMGWPGVILREEHEVVELVVRAGIPVGQLTIMRPEDGVYAVYEVRV